MNIFNGYYEDCGAHQRYHVIPGVFKKDICAANSINYEYALNMLKEKGLLICNSSENRGGVRDFMNRITPRHDSGRIRVFTINKRICDLSD